MRPLREQEVRMMTVTYKGRNDGFRWQIAEITCKDDSETARRDAILDLIGTLGYRVQIVDNNWACVEVDGMDGYKDFMADWKDCKKAVRNRR